MGSMFSGCFSLTVINLSSFDTQKTINMSNMFNGCSSLTTLDLSSFKTQSVTNMKGMFNGCSSLMTIILTSFISDKADTDDMFSKCINLYSCGSFDENIVDEFNKK